MAATGAEQLLYEFRGNVNADVTMSLLRSRDALLHLALMAAHLGEGQIIDGQSLAAEIDADLQALLRGYASTEDEGAQAPTITDADALLTRWTKKSWVYRSVDPATRIERYQLTSGASQAVRQMRALRRRTSIATESALAMVMSEMRANPTSGLMVRQLPIEGIDTKWLLKHAELVLALLGEHGDPETDKPPTTSRRRLYERLGLRTPPELVQVAVLDPALRAQVAGMRHFAASVEDLNRWRRVPETVVILENKETGYAFTGDHSNAVVLHGQGFSVALYSRIDWVRTARRVLYWGDIDAPGLQFVNDLRSHGVAIDTVLMDTETLHRFRHLAVQGAGPQRSSLPLLHEIERELYVVLVDQVREHSTGLLLEQERIPCPMRETSSLP